jgi:hypothetical protein
MPRFADASQDALHNRGCLLITSAALVCRVLADVCGAAHPTRAYAELVRSRPTNFLVLSVVECPQFNTEFSDIALIEAVQLALSSAETSVGRRVLQRHPPEKLEIISNETLVQVMELL